MPPRTSGWTEAGAPGYSHRSYRSPDGRFTFSTTTIGGSYSSRHDDQLGQLPAVMQSIGALFQGLSGTYDHHQTQRGPGMEMPPHSHAAGMREPDVMHDPFQAHHERARRHEDFVSRDQNGPPQMEPPLQSLAELVIGSPPVLAWPSVFGAVPYVANSCFSSPQPYPSSSRRCRNSEKYRQKRCRRCSQPFRNALSSNERRPQWRCCVLSGRARSCDIAIDRPYPARHGSTTGY